MPTEQDQNFLIKSSVFSSLKEAHENDVNCVRWSPTGDVFASAGADRKVKVWMPSGSNFVQRAVLTGSNAGVMAIDYDQEVSCVFF